MQERERESELYEDPIKTESEIPREMMLWRRASKLGVLKRMPSYTVSKQNRKGKTGWNLLVVHTEKRQR
jgi:hypothetical protein